MRPLRVVSDTFGVCAKPVYNGKWTVERERDFSYGKVELTIDGASHVVRFATRVMISDEMKVLGPVSGFSGRALYQVRKGVFNGKGVVTAFGINEASGTNVRFEYDRNDPLAGEIAVNLANALVPCEIKAIAANNP
jgi:hypothetical protein